MEGKFSQQEYNVYRLIEEGFKTSEIAEKLTIPFHQVQYARKMIIQKLGAANIANAVYKINKGAVRITEDGVTFNVYEGNRHNPFE